MRSLVPWLVTLVARGKFACKTALDGTGAGGTCSPSGVIEIRVAAMMCDLEIGDSFLILKSKFRSTPGAPGNTAALKTKLTFKNYCTRL